MAAKKLSKNRDFDSIKLELVKTMEYLSDSSITDFNDETENKSSLSGVMVTYIVSSKEDKLNTLLLVMTDTAFQLAIVAETEGELVGQMDDVYNLLQAKVLEVEDYYGGLHPMTIGHRFLDIPYQKFKRNGEVEDCILRLEAATKQKQTKVRSDTLKKLVMIKEYITRIKDVKENNKTYGGKESNLSTRFWLAEKANK